WDDTRRCERSQSNSGLTGNFFGHRSWRQPLSTPRGLRYHVGVRRAVRQEAFGFMTFLYPLMLGGLVAVGLPILLHLLMRQKPKHVMFPAFRFLQKRAKTNQRKIRLRHLILLLLRMLLIALIVLALARPRMFSDRTVGF